MALAYKLQEEEHAAFMDAVRASSPSPRSAGASGAGFTPASAGVPAVAAEHMDMAEDADDESLQLALQLQQEELEWQALQSRRAVAAAMGTGAAAAGVDGELDEDMQLAMRLQREEDERM